MVFSVFHKDRQNKVDVKMIIGILKCRSREQKNQERRTERQRGVKEEAPQKNFRKRNGLKPSRWRKKEGVVGRGWIDRKMRREKARESERESHKPNERKEV